MDLTGQRLKYLALLLLSGEFYVTIHMTISQFDVTPCHFGTPAVVVVFKAYVVQKLLFCAYRQEYMF